MTSLTRQVDDGPVFLSLLEMIQGQCDGFVSSQPIRLSAHGRQHPPRKTVRRNSRCKFPSRSIPRVVGNPYLIALRQSCL